MVWVSFRIWGLKLLSFPSIWCHICFRSSKGWLAWVGEEDENDRSQRDNEGDGAWEWLLERLLEMHAACSHPLSASTSLIGLSVVKTLSYVFRATHMDKNLPLLEHSWYGMQSSLSVLPERMVKACTPYLSSIFTTAKPGKVSGLFKYQTSLFTCWISL